MKTKRIEAVLLGLIVLSGATAALGQTSNQFSLTRFVIASGGGLSSGGAYSLNGTMGQPVAGGPMTNGSYNLTSGFWSQIQLVQTPGAPKFGGIRVVAGKIVISWPVAATNYRLQST